MTDSVSLREYVDLRFEEMDRRNVQRFTDGGKAVDAALSAAKEAVLKAENASERRFESVNEFRGTLGDSQRTYMPRSEAEARLASQASEITRLSEAVKAQSERRVGASTTVAYVIAGISTLVAITATLLPLLKSKP